MDGETSKDKLVTDLKPGADAVNVFAGGEGKARRHAQRRIRIRILESNAALRQAVEIGSVGQWIAIAAGHPVVVLVRHDNQNVRGLFADSHSSGACEKVSSGRMYSLLGCSVAHRSCHHFPSPQLSEIACIRLRAIAGSHSTSDRPDRQ